MGRGKVNIKSLFMKKEMLERRINRVVELIRLFPDEVAIAEFRKLSVNLDESRAQFETIIDEINLHENEEYGYSEVEKYFELFCEVKSALETLNKGHEVSCQESQSRGEPEVVRLPRLNFPQFDGDIKNWHIFWENFNRVIHSNTRLDPAQKAQYLIGQLTGRALAAVAGIPATADNYDTLVEHLSSRYQDKFKLARVHFQQLFNFKPIVRLTAGALDAFNEKFVSAYKALQNLKIPDLADFIVLQLAAQKIDVETFRNFQNIVRNEEFPTFQQLVKFLGQEDRIVDTKSAVASHKSQTFVISSAAHQRKGENVCGYCNIPGHNLENCSKFLKLDPKVRYKFITNQKRCFRCLKSGHLSSNCKSDKKCEKCKKLHHSVIHFLSDEVSKDDTGNDTPEVSVTLCNHEKDSAKSFKCTVVLPTAVVMYGYDRSKLIRVLLDSASQSHLITEACCERLRLKKRKIGSSLYGVGGYEKKILGKTSFKIHSRWDQTHSYNIEALVVDKISNLLPTYKIDNLGNNNLSRYKLADSGFHTPGEIDAVIGAELFPQIVKCNQILIPDSSCYLMDTTLGYIVMGKTYTGKNVTDLNSFVVTEEPLEIALRKFFENEEMVEEVRDSTEEVQCENIFVNGVSRNEEGRYVVKLPFKEDYQTLGDSFFMAKQRFLALEKRFEVNTKFKLLYSEIINDYLRKGYLKEVVADRLDGYFIPHHGVWKPESMSTPLRMVLDASARSSSGKSLNDILYIGKKLQADPINILMNFRLFRIALTADISKMYLQILVDPEHTKFQRIMWRFENKENLSILELTRVAFGLRSSPFLALRVIKQLIRDEGANYPLAREFASRDMYVDDIICSIPNVDLAVRLHRELALLFSSAGFELGKWSTNSADLSKKISGNINRQSYSIISSGTEGSRKVLGLRWDPQSDCFYFTFTPNSQIATKRNMLSMIARMFDPLGLISPVILTAKDLVKRLWKARIDWDEDPPSDIKGSWESFLEDLQCLSKLRIARHVFVTELVPVDLIGFCDGSNLGYGAIVYIRVGSNNVHSNLFCSKGRVTSLKRMTTPRIELCAAVLLAQLLKLVVNCLENRVNIRKIFALSDSQVVLHWINSSNFRGQTFVANRVTKIQSCFDQSIWFYVPTEDNPADLVSRGVSVRRLIDNRFWWEGPSWLLADYARWPITQNFGKREVAKVEALQTVVCLQKATAEGDPENSIINLVNRISSWMKLLRIVGYILKFLRRTKVLNNSFSAEDMNTAEEYVIKIIQRTYFGEEMDLIKKDRLNKSSIIKLFPFIDDKGILRVGGRLRNADLKFDKKHPILIPKESNIVNLIIDFYHKRYFHPGLNTLISIIRERFWIINVRRLAKKYISSCMGCFKIRPREMTSLMADLPKYRVLESRTFAHTGVDYAGPFSITLRRGRGQKSQKAYVCLFICMNVKAVHLEVCSDLSTWTVLNALKRFIARRGVCEVLYSDQGTNFVGARNVLKEVHDLSRSADYKNIVGNYLAENRIEWRFNPPGAPHFGGLWEAAVKGFKRHLYRTIGSQILSLEEFQTVCIQIEAILNSRPLTVLSEDPAEPSVLTPAHFLVAKPLVDFPGTHDQTGSYNSRPRLMENLVKDFWGRWSREYLNTLQTRQKWNLPQTPIKKGAVVLLRESNTSPLNWPLGIIEEVYPSEDGQVRVVRVRTGRGSYTRPVVKISPIPLSQD